MFGNTGENRTGQREPRLVQRVARHHGVRTVESLLVSGVLVLGVMGPAAAVEGDGEPPGTVTSEIEGVEPSHPEEGSGEGNPPAVETDEGTTDLPDDQEQGPGILQERSTGGNITIQRTSPSPARRLSSDSSSISPISTTASRSRGTT